MAEQRLLVALTNRYKLLIKFQRSLREEDLKAFRKEDNLSRRNCEGRPVYIKTLGEFHREPSPENFLQTLSQYWKSEKHPSPI